MGPQPLALCGARHVLVVAMHHMSRPVLIFWESPRSSTVAASISKGGTLRALGRALTSQAATVDSPRPSCSPSSFPLPLPNFRLALPVQHMTLSLCCLTKHWPRLPTHSHASWTNEIKAVQNRKVALGVKTGKSYSCPDSVSTVLQLLSHGNVTEKQPCRVKRLR